MFIYFYVYLYIFLYEKFFTGKEQYKILNLDLFYLNYKNNKNNCVLLKDNTVVCVYNITNS